MSRKTPAPRCPHCNERLPGFVDTEAAGRKGGHIGGKATGPTKNRGKDHYIAMANKSNRNQGIGKATRKGTRKLRNRNLARTLPDELSFDGRLFRLAIARRVGFCSYSGAKTYAGDYFYREKIRSNAMRLSLNYAKRMMEKPPPERI